MRLNRVWSMYTESRSLLKSTAIQHTPCMTGKLPRRMTGELVLSDTELEVVEYTVPLSPAGTCISSSTAANSPPAKTDVDRLNVLLELVKQTVSAKRKLDKEDTWLMEEGNTIRSEQAEIDEKQEALDSRKHAFEEREAQAKRAREDYLDAMHSIDHKLRHPDDDEGE